MLMMSLLKSLNDSEIIPALLKERFNFALFRKPYADKANLYACREILEGKEAEQAQGFIFAPFDDDNFRLIHPEYERKIDFAHVSAADATFEKPENKLHQQYIARNPVYEEYKESVSRIIEALKGRGGKTVYAVTAGAHMELDIMDAFQRLCRAYPSAFVYCWYCADSEEIWLGATPELLVSVSSTVMKTMALAGTRKAGAIDMPWDEKNSAEQKMVRDFVSDKCMQHGLHITGSKTYTRNAGVIEHICTDIEAQILEDLNIFNLIKDLSPTPAVAGLPRAEALADIRREEKFDRGYYSGLCGVCGNDSTDIYVTLRCLNLNPVDFSCTLFAGGGITASSEPELEWQEVNAKMSVLANVLELT